MNRAGRIALAFVGLLIAAFAFMLAVGISGAGHGWVTPLLFSFGLFVFYPTVLVRLTATGPNWAAADIAIVALAAIADFALYAATVREGVDYFWRVFASSALIPALWLALWFGWQALALYCLKRDLARAEDAGSS